MTLLKFICTVPALLCFCVVTLAAQEEKPRDLSRYTIGERFEMTWGLDPDGVEKLKLRARDYLWEQWRQKRLTYFLVADCLVYPEGCNDSIEYKFYVEPDETGRWLVVIESERVVSAWMSGKDKEERSPLGRNVYASVKKLAAKETSACQPLFSDRRAEQAPKVYRLLLESGLMGKDRARPSCAEF
jgi:hypothetical protein